MTEFRAKISDLGGQLGNLSSARLGRVLFFGNLAPGASVTLPDIDYVLSPVSGDGAIFLNANFRGYQVLVPGDVVSWNNTTKVLSNPGALARAVFAITFRRTTPPAGGVGLRYLLNSNGEVIIDNIHENLEIVGEGTITCPGDVVQYPPIPAGYSTTDLLWFYRWDHTQNAMVVGQQGRFLIPAYAGTYTVEWKCAARNPTTTRGTGANPVMALYREADGICTFSTRRKYARIRSLFAFEVTGIVQNGPSFPDFYNHNFIPLTAFLGMQPTYRNAGSYYAINRFPDDPTHNLYGLNTQLFGYNSGEPTTSLLGLVSVGSWPGAYHNVTLILDP